MRTMAGRQGHGGGQIAGDAVGGVVVRQGLKPRPLAVGEVLPHSPMGVDVHQPGHHIASLGVQIRRTLDFPDGGNGLVKLDVCSQESFRGRWR